MLCTACFFIVSAWKWVGLCGNFLVCIFNVRVDLRRIQIFVTQNLLQRFQIHAVRQHQRCGCVPQLMRGKLRRVKSGFQQVLFDQPMDGRNADTVFIP